MTVEEHLQPPLEEDLSLTGGGGGGQAAGGDLVESGEYPPPLKQGMTGVKKMVKHQVEPESPIPEEVRMEEHSAVMETVDPEVEKPRREHHKTTSKKVEEEQTAEDGQSPQEMVEHLKETPGETPPYDDRSEGDVAGLHLEPVSRFRIALPQIVAASAKNLLLLDLGMTVAFATIVIPVLREGRDSGGLSFTKEEASWFGSVIFVCQPLGSILSGALLEPLGRKKAMMLVNLPHILGWSLFYFSQSKGLLYLAAIIMGLGIGFMEAPIITYVSEIAQPHLRGTLTSYANLFVTFGMVLVYFLGSLVDWRHAALISAVVPVVTILAISQVPETPIWLMSRGRTEEAERALCWLRGWVDRKYVRREMEELKKYSEETKLRKGRDGIVNPGFLPDDNLHSRECVMGDGDESELTLTDKAKDLVRPGMLKPLALITAIFFFGNFTGTTSTRPYMVILAEEFRLPLDPYKATVVFGGIGFLGSVACMVTIAWLKKRPIALASFLVASLSALSIYFFKDPWVAFISYIILTFASYYGASGLVWTLLSEVFPFRGRGTATGVAAALSYLISFLATKSFQSLMDLFTLRGTFLFFGLFSLVGLVFLYFCLPETEGRPLQEIERDFEKKPPTTTESTVHLSMKQSAIV